MLRRLPSPIEAEEYELGISSGSTESVFAEPKSDPFSALLALVLRVAR